MSDTPETDANEESINYKENYGYECSLHEPIIVWPEFARKLERERDEAREDAEHWKIEYEIVEARLHGAKHKRDNGIVSEKEIIPKLLKLVERAIDDLGWFSETAAQRLQDELNQYGK